jgi:hypothetical protein
MFRISCQRVLILEPLQPILAGSLNVGLFQDLSFIGAELNDWLWVGCYRSPFAATAVAVAKISVAQTAVPNPQLRTSV